MTNTFRLRSVQVQKANEGTDEVFLLANGSYLWRGQLAQGEYEVFEELTREFTERIYISAFEEDDSSADDFIGDLTVEASDTDRFDQIATLPQEGSTYNGIYVLVYDVLRA